MTDLIRVSDVLKLLYPSSLNFVEQEHLDDGTFFHTWMEIFVNDRIMGHPTDFHGWPKRIRPVVQWIQTQNVEFHAAEERLNHKYGYTGQPDADLIWNGEPWFWDWKFAEHLSEQNRMQLTAYHHFDKRKVAFIQVKRDGTVKAIKCKPDPTLWAAFLNGLAVLKFQRSRQTKEIGVSNGT